LQYAIALKMPRRLRVVCVSIHY